MTLRASLRNDVQRIHEQVDALLDSEDGAVLLFDGRRLVSYVQGFGVSPFELERLGVEVERAVRNIVGSQPKTTNQGGSNDQSNRHGIDVDRSRDRPANPVLRLAGTLA
jgi:hypothetical protein